MDTSKRFLLCSLLLGALAVAVCVPGLGGGFIFDDRPNIVLNTALHLSELKLSKLPYAIYSFQPGNGSRMLSMASFAFDHWRGGLDPRVFKITNLLIHAISVFALAWLLLKLLLLAGWPRRRATIGSLALATAWAVHPLQISSVLYVVQRMQTLVTLFGILSLIAYLGMRQAQIEGRPSRRYALAALLCWAFGFASKEDAALYPLYTLALELSLLRFDAKDPRHKRALRIGYLTCLIVGVSAFLLYVVPRHWHWDAVPGRDFTSPERLMTQARVLVMYLGQMLIPDPGRMPFYYDTLLVSAGLLRPWTTCLSIAVLVLLAYWAWSWRRTRPVFAFGVFLFFAGHALTSNIINLELAFEHRNQFPLIGIVLAAGDLWALVWSRSERRIIPWTVAGGILCLLAGTALARAHAWGDPLRFAQYSLRIAPESPRAWMALASVHFERSRGRPSHPDFSKAVEINQLGASKTGSPSMYSNVVIYKTQRGDVTQRDWDKLLHSVKVTPVTLQTQFLLEIMVGNAENGVPLDDQGMLALIDLVAPRSTFDAYQLRRLGAYIHNQTRSPDRALRYLKMSVERSPMGDPDTENMLLELSRAGRANWVTALRNHQRLTASKKPVAR